MQESIQNVLTLYGLAERLASYCCDLPAIKSISLAGSVAEKGTSKHDVDMIFYVNEPTFGRYLATAKEWNKRCYNIASNQEKTVARIYRHDMVLQVLRAALNKEEHDTVFSEFNGIHCPPDLFVLPDGYQGRKLRGDIGLSVYDMLIIEPMRGLDDKSEKPLERSFDPEMSKFKTQGGAPLIFPVLATV